MQIPFFKYQGTGNDFIIIDNRTNTYDNLTTLQIKNLCHRNFGIGADGVILLQLKKGYHFEMVYYNADGNLGTMCGNGARCIVQFAYDVGLQYNEYRFIAPDGEHIATTHNGLVQLLMKDVIKINCHTSYYTLNTGSPHYVTFVMDVKHTNVAKLGAEIRYNSTFVTEGINVNFVETIANDLIYVRTYERGVEAETLSCGTGVTAAAIVAANNTLGYNHVNVQTLGGNLSVNFFKNNDETYTKVWLNGAASKVYNGIITI